MNSIPFSKYHGTGNDFILIDNRSLQWSPSKNDVATLCHRHFGIGADGFMLLEKANDGYDFKMVYFNSDGNVGTMCGNGGRCIVAFAQKVGALQNNQTQFLAVDGAHKAYLENNIIQLEMSDDSFMNPISNGDFVGYTGSPHYVQWVDQPISTNEINKYGSLIRYLPEYSESGINVNFVSSLNPYHLWVGTFERGVEAPTLSCGTGVTAAAIASSLKTQEPNGALFYKIDVPGGVLSVSFEKKDHLFSSVYLSGPATHVFDGIWTI